MIISIDNHVGLPFLEGLCDDLQAQIRQRRDNQSREKIRLTRVRFPDLHVSATKIATAVTSIYSSFLALFALLEMDSSL